MHWTQAQHWREHDTGMIVTALDLLKTYGTYIRVHHIYLIDLPCDQSVSMSDGTVWSRVPPKPSTTQ